MDSNPYRAPNENNTEPERLNISGWWLAISYLMPVLVMIPFLNEAGWYGIGLSGFIQRMMQITAFFIGTGCSYYGLFYGTTRQKIGITPAALGYTGLVFGILFDKYL
ncbi:MAG: hypothetical protein COA78_20180 [Blastopirellula sp.]|nr:MAG: hypothetical protein COA78_20180 [Blastopirellula sp.]